MGEELDVPIKSYTPKDDQNTYIKYGLNQVQGWKKSMEDYVIDYSEKEQEKFLNVFGIFDGHGGKEVPRYLQAHFMDYLKKTDKFKEGKFKDALIDTFFELDKSFTTKEAQEELTKYSEELKPSQEQEIKDINNLLGAGEKLNQDELEQVMAFNEVFDPRNIENANIAEFTGSTGIILFLGDKNIYIANAGNSRCLVINKEGTLINKTKDHTINEPEEKKRVELARSFNEEEEKKKEEDGVKTEYLDSTRGFGDWEFKGNEWIDQKDQEISVEPEILEVPINDVQYLIMGSHGMFECGKDNENDDTVNNQICTFFMDEIKKNADKPYSKIIEEYFEKIIPDKNDGNNIKGLDNMSCIVVNLKNEPISAYIEKKEIEEKERKKKEEEEKKRKKEEERKKREEERKKKEEEKKKKEEAKKQVEEPKKEEPKIEEPKKEEPKIEEPKKEEPKNEEPKKDEESKKDEEPKKEEVKIEEDKKEENKNEIKEEKNEIKEEKKDEIKEENKNEINEDKKEEKKEENEIKPQEEEKNNEAQ